MKRIFDIVYQSRNHRKMSVYQYVRTRGVVAKVTRISTLTNGYETVMPEPEVAPSAQYDISPDTFNCMVVVDTPLDGVDTGNENISLSDKVEKELLITSDGDLKYDDQVELHYPDGRTINLRVVEVLEKFAYSETGYKFSTVVM